MYVPEHFAMTADEQRAHLESIEAADLITPSDEGLLATFLPLLYDPKRGEHGALLGHVARNNSQWRLAAGSEASRESQVSRDQSLVIARGPDAYISPSFYATKREHGRVVPTWNYVTLHVHGQLVAHDDIEWLRSLVTRLTNRHESRLATPWAVTDAPAPYIEGQLKAIVGVELLITRVEAKAKLSQNRSVADREGIVAGTDNQAMAAAVTATIESTRPPA